MQDPIFPIMLLGGMAIVIGAVAVFRRRMMRERREALLTAMRVLGASEVRTRHAVIEAVVQGIPVDWHLVTGSRSTPDRTVCSAALRQPPPLEMELRPQTSKELAQVRAGRAVDVTIGVEAFDDAFIIEAAPSDVARALLDAPTRERLLGLRPVRLWLTKGMLRIDVVGSVEAHVARAMMELLLSMVRRLGELPRELAERRLAEARGHSEAGYRGLPPEAMPVASWAPKAEAEIAALTEVRTRRQLRKTTLVLVFVALWLAFLIIVRCSR